MPALTFIVRHLAAALSSGSIKRYPALESILARSKQPHERHESITDFVFSTLGLNRRGDWPVGAVLAAASEDEKDSAPEHRPVFWVCAQPVHLAVDRDSLILQPLMDLQLSEAESHGLFETVRQHLAADQLEVRHAGPGFWCIGSRREQAMETTETALVEGGAIDDSLPLGADGQTWQRLVTELQMLLHGHPVNITREDQGLSPINSIWLWGSGVMPRLQPGFDLIVSEDPILRAAGMASGARTLCPMSGPGALPEARSGLVDLDLTAIGGEDPIAIVERDWLRPAWDRLANGSIDQLTVVIPLRNGVTVYRCGRRERRRFWRRRRPLAMALPRAPEVRTDSFAGGP